MNRGDIMGIGKRIKELRENKKLKQDELAKLVGVSASAIGNYETEVSHPKETVLYKLISVLNCDANYLFQDVIAPSKNIKFSIEEQNHIKKYHVLDEHGKDIVDTVLIKEYERMLNLQAEIERQLEVEQSKQVKLKYREVEFSEYPASAGTGSYLFDDIKSYTVKIELNETTRNANLVIPIKGDSMEPDYYDGEHIAVEYRPNLDIGDVGVFVFNNESYIKKLGNRQLISLNKKHPPIKINEYDNIRVVGKVLGKVDIYR